MGARVVLELAIVVASCGPFGAPPEGLKAKRTRKWINNQQFTGTRVKRAACWNAPRTLYVLYPGDIVCQGATICFDLDRNDSSPTWPLRNQPTPLSEIYIIKR